MKRIILVIALVLCLFQIVALVADIDIGSPAVNRSLSSTARTLITKVNPANASGIITTIELYAVSSLADVEVATFFVVSGNNLSTRDSHTIGAVTSGSKQTFSGLDIDVQAGDYIGLRWSDGLFERDTGGAGFWYLSGDNIPCTDLTFDYSATPSTYSIYGTGVIPTYNYFGYNSD